MKASLAMMILGAGAAATAYNFLRVRRHRHEKRGLKEEIRKWEDEGGNVPHVPTVSPVVTPEKSVPELR